VSSVAPEKVLEKLKALLTSESATELKRMAADFVHESRVRSLSSEAKCELEGRLDLIRGTLLFRDINRWIETGDEGFICRQECAKSRICSKDILMTAPGGCIAALVSLGLKRPVDFFLRSVPQETSELLALMFVEKGEEILEEGEYRVLSTLFKRSY
jgi:hypothetical protein